MPHPHLAHDVEPRHLAATATLAAILMAAPAAIRADTTGTAPAAPPTVGLAAAALVAHEDGYRAVITDVRGWHQTLRNGCVAFVASALAQVGMTVPDERLSDSPWSNPARVTFSLDRYLADQGWNAMADPAALHAGDLVFTTGAPDHVMLFHGWADAARRWPGSATTSAAALGAPCTRARNGDRRLRLRPTRPADRRARQRRPRRPPGTATSPRCAAAPAPPSWRRRVR